ncbi:MAG: hypothetical protein LBU85_08635 [Treponema sp.]|jgi:hypothetical protein|nr:hypothetical protein [Treponema sp.]
MRKFKKSLTVKHFRIADLSTPHSLLALIFSLLSFIFYFSCEQPFKAGLGTIIDLQIPDVKLTYPAVDSYIRGLTEFTGTAEDDYKLKDEGRQAVYFCVTSYPNLATDFPDVKPFPYKSIQHPMHNGTTGTFYRAEKTGGDGRDITWKFEIDTLMTDSGGMRLFQDGTLLIELLVIDSLGKEYQTNALLFNIKNDIPKINTSAPSILNDDFNKENLNYDYIKNPNIAPAKPFPRVMDSEGWLIGMITDSQGVYRDPETADKFPPQIRFWQVIYPGETAPAAPAVAYSAGYLPTESEVPWVSRYDDKGFEDKEIDAKSLMFTYRLPKESGTYWAFQIRAQSVDEKLTTAYFPQSYINYNGKTQDFIDENSYILIKVMEPLEYPVLDLYRLEDIYGTSAGADAWDTTLNANKGGYKDIIIPEPEKSDGNYVYIDNFNAEKGGAFTLRMKASHTGGIASAKVYWEKDDKSAKGRFIWDPADTPPSWYTSSVSGTLPYEQWGLRDPHNPTDTSFVFTYKDDKNDTIPSAGYGTMSGKQKVQKYTGPLADSTGKTYDFDELPDPMTNWDGLIQLDEGTYNLYVYATSVSGTRVPTPFTLQLKIDRGAPELELNYIEGCALEDVLADGTKKYTVNGVIRPKFILSDSRSVDTGFRTATSDYFKIGANYGFEQAYILVPMYEKAKMDAYTATRAWPPFTETGGVKSVAIPNVTTVKHGIIDKSACLFKTSKNYSTSQAEGDSLADGEYWLYAFARDRAFNVGCVSFPIQVELASDKPKFDLNVINVDLDVQDPDVSHDYPNGTDSFIVQDADGNLRVRNTFTPNSNIRVKITDDDSLDLGVGKAGDGDYKPSGITVEIQGSTTNLVGTTPVTTEDTNKVSLSDADIKNAFKPQALNAGKRNAVKDITGTINQTALLDALKNDPTNNYDYLFPEGKANYTSLPDGFYKVTVTIRDYVDAPSGEYSGAKLILPTDANNPAIPAEVKTEMKSFWIAVDTKPPKIDVDTRKNDYTPDIKGTVSDENGPVTLVSWKVKDVSTPINSLETDDPLLDKPRLIITPLAQQPFLSDKLWTYKFEYKMYIPNGYPVKTLDYEITFRDRFGTKLATRTIRYSLDNEPPVVSLTKLIETFQRPYDDVLLAGAPVSAGNKDRLAVKTVSFSLNAQDNFKVAGIHWWLLPANKGSGDNALDASGLVLKYNAFPAKAVNPVADVSGVYYPGDTGVPAGFEGAYGVVDMENRQFTIAVDSEKMIPANGEYRLHIIAVDDTGNESVYYDQFDTAKQYPNLFQTVFFLQEEDKPYFVTKASGTDSGGSDYAGAISPDRAGGNTGVIGDLDLTIRGTIYDNNGFGDAQFWPGTITIWFKNSASRNPSPGDYIDHALPSGWETLVENDSPITGYAMVTVPNPPLVPSTGLGRMGRNLSLNLDLKKLFPSEFASITDGVKHYIVKATDSPVNKIKFALPGDLQKGQGSKAGFAGGPPAVETPGTDDIMRVSRWNRYSFEYDSKNPVIKVTAPPTGESFGSTFNSKFTLEGYLEDANLVKTADGKYYFEYFLDSETTRTEFPLDVTYITDETTDSNEVTTVEFKIPAAIATAPNGIIPQDKFDALAEGYHTLTLVVKDKSGKEGSVMYSFIKDVNPPAISFINIDNAYNKIDPNNANNVNYKSGVPNTWWLMTPDQRRVRLLEEARLLTTIRYEANEKPVLTGMFTDEVSNIAVTTDANNINRYTVDTPPDYSRDGTFRYWIDRDYNASQYSVPALIDGSGRNVRWTIWLTDTGTETGIPLKDGVHTIELEVEDTSGNANVEHLMFAFRIDSKPPKAEGTITVTDKGGNAINQPVFGKSEYQDDPAFILKGKFSDANLEDLELRIVDKTNDSVKKTVLFSNPGASGDAPNVTQTWVYQTPDKTTPAPAEDYISLDWTYRVTKTVFDALLVGLPSGSSFDIIVRAKDYANNWSDEFTWTFTVDTGAPVISFPSQDTNPNGDLKPQDFIDVKLGGGAPEPKNNINYLMSANLKISGEIEDAASKVKEAESIVWKWNWNKAPDGEWVIIENWTPLKILTQAGKVNWTKNFMGQEMGDLDISQGPINDELTNNPNGEGLYRIQIRAKDVSVITAIPPGTNDWDSATGMGNPVTSDYVYFYYDRTDRGEPSLTVSAQYAGFYSTKISGGKFEFTGMAVDNNRFAKVEVVLKPVAGAKFPEGVTGYSETKTISPVLPGTLNYGTALRTWAATLGDNTDPKPDGRYEIKATVYDMTGKAYTITQTFTLDNTAPGARFTGPAKESSAKYKGNGTDTESSDFASVIVNGGQGAVITGTTEDKSLNNSESGIDQMWFHLGFLENNTAFPEKTQILGDVNTLIAAAKAQPGNGSKTDNELMDIVSEYRAVSDTDTLGNAWFKLGGTQKPTGFIINNPNIYDWRMEIPNKYPDTAGNTTDLDAMVLAGMTSKDSGNYQIGGLKLYGSDIIVKGRRYNVVRGSTPDNYRLQMARLVPGQAGVYRLPLWIRLVDKVGNVEYYCHDIFFYPEGDIPTTSIDSLDNGNKDKARGGTISVDGTARSNTSVFDVIFRVFADDVPNTDLDGTKIIGSSTTTPNGNQPLPANVVRIPGYEPVPVNSATWLRIPAAYRNTDVGSNSNWYSANLSLKGGAGEPIIPWSFTINAGDQIKNLISAKGFPASGSGTPDMIRVWVEVFVFNGEGSPIRSSIYQDDGKNTAGGALYGVSDPTPPYYHPGPKPYVRAFYIKAAAPQITHPNVGDWNSGSLVWNPEDPSAGPTNPGGYGYKGAGTEIRRDKFALRAILDPNPNGTPGSGLGEVTYRTRLDGGPWSTWVSPPLWTAGPPAAALPVKKDGITIKIRDTSGSRTRYDFEYDIDSKAAANSVDYGAINNGAWASTGGTITVQVRIKDNATPPNEAEQTIQVAVDNFAPVADETYKTNPKVAGTNVDFMGRVFDFATTPAADAMMTEYTPRKLDRVYAWFTKGTGAGMRYVNINTGTTALSPANSRQMTAFNGRTATVAYKTNDSVDILNLTNRGAPVTYTVPQLGAGESAHNAAWVRVLSESTATPGTKMLWAPINSENYNVRWSFTVDSTVLPDGDLTLHYIVVDASGNASYYEQKTSVRNKYPQIERVTLYTNNIGVGAAYTQEAEKEYVLNDYRGQMFNNMAVTDAEIAKTGYLNSGFISKNQYIGFAVETLKGNRPLNFRLEHVTRTKKKLDFATLTAMVKARNDPAAYPNSINLYTIAKHGNYSNARWKELGVPADNAPVGTHFVLQRDTLPSAAVNKPDGTPNPDYYPNDLTAEVWEYTLAGSQKQVLHPAIPQQTPGDTGSVVFGDVNADGQLVGPYTGFSYSGAGDFAYIAEKDGSHPDEDDDKTDNPADTAFFLIRVWDTVNTDNSYTEAWVNDQLYDAVVIGMNVYKTDKTPPVARLYDLNPYTETAVANTTSATIRRAADPQFIGSNIVRGGLYNAGTTEDLIRSGYIDPRGGSKALNPVNSNNVRLPDYPLKVDTDAVPALGKDQVSGKVILRGHAWDDQLIDEIKIKIAVTGGTGGTEQTILKFDDTGLNGNPPTYQMAAGSGFATTAFAVEELHWKTGHSVEWAYVWDTAEAMSGGPGNVTISVSVKDKKGGPSSTGLTSSTVDIDDEIIPTKFHNTVNVDIVPYITGFERRGRAAFSTKRSLQGWFSFYQGESNIAVKGYNFGGGTVSMTMNGTNLPVTGTSTTERIFSIPSAATSGEIKLTAGATAAYNNASSTAGKSWNREYNANTPGSDLWVNRHNAHIWRTFEDTAAAPRTIIGVKSNTTTDANSAGLDHPGMALEYTGSNAGTLHGTWSVYGNANVYWGTNNYSGSRLWGGDNNSASPPGEPFAAADISIYNGGGVAAANIGFTQLIDGRPLLIARAKVDANISSSSLSGSNTLMEPQKYGNNGRWKNIRLSKQAANSGTDEPNVGMLYMAAHDAQFKGLWFGIANNGTRTTMYIDGGRDTAQTPGMITTSGGGLAASASAGEYSAVDYDNIGPIIAYYDQQNDTVRVALGSSFNPGTTGWNRRYLLPSTGAGSELYRGSGGYISIKVDKGNHIHLAFYNSVYNKVVYYYAASRADIGAAPNGTTIKAHTVDQVITGGTWTDVSVDDKDNPWIVYGDSTRTGNYDGVRAAYKSSSTTGSIQFTGELKCPVTKADITGWEALTMPATYTVNNDRLNIEVWPPTVRGGSLGTRLSTDTWDAAVGYASDMYRVGYFYYPR